MSDVTLIAIVVGTVTGVIGVLLFFVIARKKGMKIGQGRRMGMDLSGDHKCPNCGANLPTVRRPRNLRQALWGGWTCETCGKEFDKWLQPLDGSG